MDYIEKLKREDDEFMKKIKQKREQKSKNDERWEIFRNENPNFYNDYMIEEEDLQDGKYIYIF
jgi:hypothetical protein